MCKRCYRDGMVAEHILRHYVLFSIHDQLSPVSICLGMFLWNAIFHGSIEQHSCCRTKFCLIPVNMFVYHEWDIVADAYSVASHVILHGCLRECVKGKSHRRNGEWNEEFCSCTVRLDAQRRRWCSGARGDMSPLPLFFWPWYWRILSEKKICRFPFCSPFRSQFPLCDFPLRD